MPVTHHSGYLMVCLRKNKMQKNAFIHRLVAEAFIPNQSNYPFINHKDENKDNNKAENLEWCTCQYNNTYGTRIEKARKSVSKAVLQCELNGEIIKYWDSLTVASNCLHICKASISQCCNGKYKTAGGFVWKFQKALV